ncbi:alcohol dehydrogenase catalytic domain-containing protein [Corynebacterium breve]|uniref:Alcohol dehydrogenase catalytic domain-containing protein n=1 Tax=Corynebacterium breve TaxID=3049799 RepID=A0ABY8VG98_9CORY|nr:alcohol dehydrogenase catalytic domain-containing protein [Corynebacterium breve]WIM68337.1 alcohol dehydrogenase catalytic domain-containing protein [Corynebacterium breve]
MRAVIIHGPGDIRVEEVEQDTVENPTDAVIEVKAACVCGSDLWPFRGLEKVDAGARMGHEYVGVVSEIGAEVKNIAVGDWVVGSFVASCGNCEICVDGDPSGCINREFMGGVGTQAEYARIPWADGTLVKLPAAPTPEQLRHVLAASDVLGTGWFAADAAAAGPGKIVAVVGDGAVGLSAVLGAKALGAERIIISSRNPQRQALAKAFGATDIVEERGDEFADKVVEMTGGYGAHSTVEAVGSNEAMHQAIRATRRGGSLGFVGVSHGVELRGAELFGALIHLHGGPAPVRRYLPELVDRIYSGEITPGDVFDLTLPLDQALEAYQAMDERKAIKVMLTP